jgi:predicted nuclease of predicted toxin-antitoxin system
LKVKLDENLPEALAELLRSRGIDAHTTLQEGLQGAKDGRLLDTARREGRVLWTYDTDFADIRRFPPADHAGIIVFRLADQRWQSLESRVKALLDSQKLESMAACLAIVDEDRVRIKR